MVSGPASRVKTYPIRRHFNSIGGQHGQRVSLDARASSAHINLQSCNQSPCPDARECTARACVFSSPTCVGEEETQAQRACARVGTTNLLIYDVGF